MVVVIGGRGIVTSGSRYGVIATSGVGISADTTAAVGAGGDGGSGACAVFGGGSGGGSGDGGGGAFDAFRVGDTSTVIVVGVRYDYGVGGAIGSIAVGPPEHSQHNIRATDCRETFGRQRPTSGQRRCADTHPASTRHRQDRPTD